MEKKPLLAAAEYRTRAAGARARAQMMPTENAKLLMTRIAEDYERMALDRERFEESYEQHRKAPQRHEERAPAPPQTAINAHSGT